jgi:guanine deaminase
VVYSIQPEVYGNISVYLYVGRWGVVKELVILLPQWREAMTRHRQNEHPDLSLGSAANLLQRPQLAMNLFNKERAERFMRRAIELGRKGAEAGDGGPFGTVIVKDGEIIGEGWNRVVATNDPTAHGEIVAIRNACKWVNAFSLKGCELYTSGEPCPMCLSAIYWARVERVFYGFRIQDVAEVGFDDRFIYEQLAKPFDRRKIPGAQVLGAEALRVLKAYAADPKRMKY